MEQPSQEQQKAETTKKFGYHEDAKVAYVSLSMSVQKRVRHNCKHYHQNWSSWGLSDFSPCSALEGSGNKSHLTWNNGDQVVNPCCKHVFHVPNFR